MRERAQLLEALTAPNRIKIKADNKTLIYGGGAVVLMPGLPKLTAPYN